MLNSVTSCTQSCAQTLRGQSISKVVARNFMGDLQENLIRSGKKLVAPVANDVQSDCVQDPEIMAEEEAFDNENLVIERRGEHHEPAELQKGLTVFTAAVFITGEMAGSGILALPAAIVGAGLTGFALLILCCFASGYCGTVLGRSWATLRDRHDEYKGHVRYPYPAIGEKAYGRWASVAVTVCINVTLIGIVSKFSHKFA